MRKALSRAGLRAVLAAALFVAGVALLAGCSGNGAKKQLQIGIAQFVEHPALNSVLQGIQDGLAQQGFKDGEQIKIEIENAQGQIETAKNIADQFVSEHKDMIIAIATPTAQAAAQATKEIPIVFATVTDPVAAGLVTSMEQTDGNITGTSDQLPMALQIELIQSILPNVKTIGVIYSTSEVNAGVQVEAVEKAAGEKGIAVHKVGIAQGAEVKAAAESLVGKVDAILITVDNTVVSSAEAIFSVAEKAKIPVFASDIDTVKRGAVATHGIDYYKMGVQTGEMAARILKGEAIKDNPVEVTKETDLIINLKAAKTYGITVPDELLQKAKEVIQ